MKRKPVGKPAVIGAVLGAALSAAAFTSASAYQQLAPSQAISLPSGQKITSFDISFVDTVSGNYYLADRTEQGHRRYQSDN